MFGFKRCFLLGLLSFFFFIIMTIPASLLVSPLDELLQNTPIKLNHGRGTIWAGYLDLTINKAAFEQLGTVRVRWSIKPLSLLAGRFGIDYQLDGTELQLKGAISEGVGPLELKIDTASFGPVWVNALLSQQRIAISNPVNLEGFLWRFELQDKFTHAAQGKLTWKGGQVAGGRLGSQTLQIEAIEGNFSANSQGEAELEIKTQSTQAVLMKSYLLASGVLKLQVLKRVQGLIGMGQASSPDDILVNLQQKIF